MKVNILCLYYDIMNLYGDTGNVKVLKYHLDEQGIDYNIDYKSIDDKLIFKNYDLVMIGAGKFFISTGNSISMFGNKLYDKDGIGLFDYTVSESDKRISKEVILDNDMCKPIYGFFNHQDIISNHDNYLFRDEGIHYKNFYGTFTLGPILSRNPEFLEYFFKKFISSLDDKFKFKDMDLSLNRKAY